MKQQSGFTLIELIVVIVILGILAATALPKFIDLSSDARTSATAGAAAALTSASSINYGAYLVRGSGGSGVVRLTGASAGLSLATNGGVMGWDTSKFSITTDVSCAGSTNPGSSGLATVQYNSAANGTTANTATATIICTG